MGKTIRHGKNGTTVTRTYRDSNGTRHVYTHKVGLIGQLFNLIFMILKLPFLLIEGAIGLFKKH